MLRYDTAPDTRRFCDQRMKENFTAPCSYFAEAGVADSAIRKSVFHAVGCPSASNRRSLSWTFGLLIAPATPVHLPMALSRQRGRRDIDHVLQFCRRRINPFDSKSDSLITRGRANLCGAVCTARMRLYALSVCLAPLQAADHRGCRFPSQGDALTVR